MKKEVLKLAVLSSENGIILQEIIDAIISNVLDAKINAVVSDNKDAYALERARKAGIESYIIRSHDAKGRDEELSVILDLINVEIIILDHYFKNIGPKVLENFIVLNTYPPVFQNHVDNETIWKLHVPGVADDTLDEKSVHNKKNEKSQIVSILRAFSEGKIDYHK